MSNKINVREKIRANFTVLLVLIFMLTSSIPTVYAGTADCVFGLSSTDNTQLSVGSNVDVGISITLPTTADPFTLGITAVGLEVRYDPAVISYVNSSGISGTAAGIVSTDFEAPTVIKNGGNPAGKIIITYSTANSDDLH